MKKSVILFLVMGYSVCNLQAAEEFQESNGGMNEKYIAPPTTEEIQAAQSAITIRVINNYSPIVSGDALTIKVGDQEVRLKNREGADFKLDPWCSPPLNFSMNQYPTFLYSEGRVTNCEFTLTDAVNKNDSNLNTLVAVIRVSMLHRAWSIDKRWIEIGNSQKDFSRVVHIPEESMNSLENLDFSKLEGHSRD